MCGVDGAIEGVAEPLRFVGQSRAADGRRKAPSKGRGVAVDRLITRRWGIASASFVRRITVKVDAASPFPLSKEAFLFSGRKRRHVRSVNRPLQADQPPDARPGEFRLAQIVFAIVLWRDKEGALNIPIRLPVVNANDTTGFLAESNPWAGFQAGRIRGFSVRLRREPGEVLHSRANTHPFRDFLCRCTCSEPLRGSQWHPPPTGSRRRSIGLGSPRA